MSSTSRTPAPAGAMTTTKPTHQANAYPPRDEQERLADRRAELLRQQADLQAVEQPGDERPGERVGEHPPGQRLVQSAAAWPA